MKSMYAALLCTSPIFGKHRKSYNYYLFWKFSLPHQKVLQVIKLNIEKRTSGASLDSVVIIQGFGSWQVCQDHVRSQQYLREACINMVAVPKSIEKWEHVSCGNVFARKRYRDPFQSRTKRPILRTGQNLQVW